MSRATYPLKLPNSVKKAAQRLAKEDGVSLNQWIAAAVAEKVGVMETAADFFKKRAGKAKGDGLTKFLRNALLLLLCLPALAGGTDDGRVQGAWLLNSVKWTNAPADINPHLQSGPAEILYFRQDRTFALIYCVVNRVPKQYEIISHGDPQDVYLGKWEAEGDNIAVEYRLVSRTVKIKGEALPGPIQHATIKASDRVLHLERKTFHRTVGLDKSAAEVVNGLPPAQ